VPRGNHGAFRTRREPVAVTQVARCLRRRARLGLAFLGELPRISVLLELRDDVVGDGEPLVLRQALLEPAYDLASVARHRQ
jgi:hypothetical protein